MNCLKCGAEVDDFMEVCPGCMAPFCHECEGAGSINFGGLTPWGAPINLPCPSCTAKWDDLAHIGAAWRQDSSLEKWFPITAEQIAKERPLLDLINWLMAGKYRHLVHRHDGNFRAIDEALNVWWTSDCIDDLAQLIRDNPVTEKAP